jgi:filamentous hemagglutinin family protein
MSGISTRWFFGIANWCAIGSAFGVAVSLTIATSANCALAQITPDSNLPNNSSVNLNGSTFDITGGTSAGSNLFHSFQEFSVPNGNAAIFQNPVNILNIISRVTGESPSKIDGQIGTSGLGRANLFLINPNGIVFGSNATLNVGGSFVATTANAIGFGNQGIFSASNPNNPALLTVNPSALVFNQIAKSIENKSRAPIENNPAGFPAFGLRVPNGKSLLLVGGDIKMDGGQLNAYGGRVELGGLANPGTVALLNDDNNLSSSFPNDDVAKANVSLSNDAGVFVQAAGGGSIAVNARDLEVSGGSTLSAGIGQGLGSVDTVGGDIRLNATGEIKVVGQNSTIYNYVRPRGQGKGGNLIIKTRELLVQDGGQVSTITRGPGKGGNLTVTARSVKVSNGDLLAQTRENATGAAGDLTIETGSLRVQDGGRISASTYGAGQAGNLTVTAGSVEVSNGNLFAQANENTTGAAGDLTINTGTLLVKDGAQVSASTSGSGKGGNLTVTARSVEVSNRGDLLAQTRENATGAAGNLTIETGSLRVQDGGRISASTYGAGQAGNLTVTAESVEVSNGNLFAQANQDATGAAGDLRIKTGTLLVKDGAEVSTSTSGSGKGGYLTVTARSVEVSNRGNLLAQTRKNATGAAGDLTISTSTLLVKDGGRVSASTYGSGEGGNLTVTAESVEVSNGNLFAQANQDATGAAGNLTIETGTLLVKDGAEVSTSTDGSGEGGNLTVTARSVEVSNRGNLFAEARKNATGAAGDLTINTGTLLVKDRGEVSASTSGAGQGGNLTVNASDSVEVTGTTNDRSITSLSADTQGTGNAGNLTIDTKRLVVKNSQVSTTTFGKGDAGILTVNASESIDLSGVIFGKTDDFPAGLFAQVNSQGEGGGGKLNIETGRLSISNGAKVQVATFGQGNAGDLFIRAKEIDIFETPQPKYTNYPTGIFAGVQTIPAATKPTLGNGGSATIETNRLTVRDGGVVTSSTQGQGNAGSLEIRATESIEVFGTAPDAQFRLSNEPKNSEISAAVTPESIGNAGSLSIDTGRLIVRDGGTVTVRNEGKGETSQAGNLQITARSINLNQGSLTANTNSGNGGDIILNASDLLLLRNNSTISASAGTDLAGGNGGNITINAPSGFIVAAPNENSDITANASSGSGGRVTINATGIYGIAPLSRQDLERRLPPGAVLNPRQLPTNDITAISQQNPSLSGQVNVNTPNVDPSQGLVQLPTVLVDTPRLVSSGCAAFDSGNSSFTITGRGGLPPSPEELLTNDVVWSDNRILQTMTQQYSSEKPLAKPILKPKPEPVAIVPATGWVFNGKGQVTLISSAPKATGLGSNPANCPTQ